MRSHLMLRDKDFNINAAVCFGKDILTSDLELMRIWLAGRSARRFSHPQGCVKALSDRRRNGTPHTQYLRAQRLDGGARTFRIVPGEPMQTAFGEDLYVKIFGTIADASSHCQEKGVGI